MGAPVLIGAGIGAATSLATGGNPLQGALLGGVGGGVFGGSAGLGSGFKQGGLFNLGSGLSGAGTLATNTPTMGGLALEGAKTGIAGTGAGVGAGAGMSDYVGSFVPEHLTNSTGIPMDNVASAVTSTGVSDNMPLLMTTEGAKGTPLSTTDKLLNTVTPSGGYSEGNFISDMVQKDPMGSAMLTNAAAQNLLSRPTAPIETTGYIPVKKGATDSDPGAPLNVLSPSDYGYDSDMVTDKIAPSGSTYSVFPQKERGFGGYTMFYR
jgi:hypothetical protein